MNKLNIVLWLIVSVLVTCNNHSETLNNRDLKFKKDSSNLSIALDTTKFYNKNSSNGAGINRSLPTKDWELLKIEGSVIFFKNGEKFQTDLFELQYHGVLKTTNKAPFLVLSGKQCDSCGANISIYIHSPSDGGLKNESEQDVYAYPGKLFDYESGKTIFQSILFIGNCVDQYQNSAIWLQKKFGEKDEIIEDAYIINVVDDKLKIITLVDRNILLKLYELKNNALCNEIKGMNQTIEP